MDPQLPVDIAGMPFDGAERNVQVPGDLLVRKKAEFRQGVFADVLPPHA